MDIVCMDCLQFMRSMEDDSVDLVMTSPPYAMQRKSTYGGVDADRYPFWMETVGKEIFRVLKPSGSFVLNIKENVEDGVRSFYVYETVGRLARVFRWTDTFIWNKLNPFPTGSKKRLKDGFEYCYWFTKTPEYKFFPDSVLVPSTSKYLESEKRRKNKAGHKCKNGSGMDMTKRYVSDMIRPSNVISLATDTTNHLHPASFPLGLPLFFIKLMTEEDDVVFDPFMGSGTTLLAAQQLGRKYTGCDVVEKYVEITNERLDLGLFQGVI